ncbi:hypothetical protein GCM10028820_12880 [Tessaracoccus terricola]
MLLRTYAELVATGLSQRDIEARIRGGTLTRVRRGVYGSADELDPEETHRRLIHAVVPAVSPDNVLSHESAAVLHGLPVPRSALGKVAMNRRSGGHAHSSAHLVVRDTKLADDEVTQVGGMNVTTVARTALDLARCQSFEWAVAAGDAALRLGIERSELLEIATAHSRLRGLPLARQAFAFADGRAESPGESISRVQFARHGLPAPELQFEIHDDDGNWAARVDFLWRDWGLAGECDGMGKYGPLLKPGQTPERAIRDEKRREEAVRDAGWGMTRWDWDLAWQGAALCARILRAAERERRRR